jgi:cyanate permease
MPAPDFGSVGPIQVWPAHPACMAAGGVALVVSIASSVGPYIIGMLKEQTGGYATAIVMLALGLVLSAVIVLRIGGTMALRQRTA